MAESSWPTATGTGVTGTTWEQMAVNFFGDGLFGTPNLADLVYADSTGRQVKIRANRLGGVRGFTWTSGPSDLTKPVTANASSGTTRIDRVVLGLNRSGAWPVTAYVKAGTAVTSNPQPPVLQQDPTSGGTGIFEIPLAKIGPLANGYTTVAATDITPEAWYLGPPSVTAKSGTMPPSVLGLRVYQSDTGITLIGTGTTFKAALDDSGWKPVTGNTGWQSAMKVRKFNGLVTSNGFGFKRSGAALNAGTDQTVGYIPVGYRPDVQVGWNAYIDGTHQGFGYIDPSGAVVLQQYTTTIPTGVSVGVQNSQWIAA